MLFPLHAWKLVAFVPISRLFCSTQTPFVASGVDKKFEQTEKIGQLLCNPDLSVSSRMHLSPNLTNARHVLSFSFSPFKGSKMQTHSLQHCLSFEHLSFFFFYLDNNYENHMLDYNNLHLICMFLPQMTYEC